MIKIKHISFLISFVTVIVLFISCKKTPDRPPITPFNIANTLTISELRTLFNNNGAMNYKFTKDVSLFATVMMTDNYKTLYIRDNTGAICVKQITAHGIYAGDSLRINLNGSTLDLSGVASSLQIDSVDVSSSPTNKVVKLAVGKPTTPITVTIAQLNHSTSDLTYSSSTGSFFVPQSIYDGELVQINDVQFALIDSGYFITPSTGALYYSHNLYDCGGLNTMTVSLYGGTVDFLNQKVPHTKSGSIIAAASFYNNALQLTPRSFADLNFNQPRCGMQTLNQTFDTVLCGSGANITALFPGWSFLRQVGYYQPWSGTTSGSTYFPSASVKYSTDTRNVAWVITPPIQNSPTKNINLQVATTTNTSVYNQLSVLISTDYNGYNLGGVSPVTIGTQAHWTDITSSFDITTSGLYSSWVFYGIGPAHSTTNPVYLNSTAASSMLSGYTGTFYIGFRYTGNLVDSTANYGINNVVINN